MALPDPMGKGLRDFLAKPGCWPQLVTIKASSHTRGDETDNGSSGAEGGGWVWLLDTVLDPQTLLPPLPELTLLCLSLHPEGSVYQDNPNSVIC